MIKNTTDIPNGVVKSIIEFCKPNGVKKFDVMIKNGSRLAGAAYSNGNPYHSNARPFIVCRIPKCKYPNIITPYEYAHLKGKKYYVCNKIEALVYVAAHELRHLWQALPKSKSLTPKGNGYTFGSKGVFSEVDTESYAIHMLRKWRQ